MRRSAIIILSLAIPLFAADRPAPIVTSTFIGGRGLDFGGNVAFDADGNIIISGSSDSLTTPWTTGTENRYDVFVTKLTSDGKQVIWTKLIGGSRTDDSGWMAIGGDGAIYLAGRTDSIDFPVTANAPQKTLGGGTYDAFVVKLAPNDGAVEFATYWGGNGADAPDGIAVDANGNIVIAGDTTATDYPTVNAFQSMNRGGSDIFVARFAPDGHAVFSTLIGSSASDAGHGVDVDRDGNAYVVGFATGDDFPVVDARQPQFGGGGGDFVIIKFATDGSVVFSTFFGGTGFDGGDDIKIANDGSIWVTGRVANADMPLVNPLKGYGGGRDVFLAKFDATGKTLLFSTFLGGTGDDDPIALSVTSDGSPIVAGQTSSADFPLRNATQSAHGGGSLDGFVAVLSRDLKSLAFSTYAGGRGFDQCTGVAARDNEVAFVGTTVSDNFIIANAIQPATIGLADEFLTVVDLTPPRARAVRR